ncbi:mycofactocin biosynthesis peptidyl-dipeptidase MftE [Kribbia dieselivorans]|uniref:mycofactocin biosynthesis peptidyl-dipeptidase MftE n=1 Tax=Kribbia dieselivorans TaxID=331526 RepID=UPI0008387277|nr:mycofactocin biosynthesis peptidyl-dipeptidase MftE [Kribbia dieselivorans]
MNLAESTSPESTGAGLVLVPVGSIEQHGPHLPLDTDTVIAQAVCETVAARLPGTWVAPPVVYGASGEHQMFPGTCSIGSDVLRSVIVELTRSLRTWATRVVYVNAHGGNLTALRPAVEQMVGEGHDVAWLPCETELVDLHAGLTETSLLLHLRPESVRLDRAEAGNTAPLTEILPTLMAHGMAAVTPNGVLGDPTGASAAHGAEVMAAMVARVEAGLVGSVGSERR